MGEYQEVRKRWGQGLDQAGFDKRDQDRKSGFRMAVLCEQTKAALPSRSDAHPTSTLACLNPHLLL
jgi:hypothetical protein